MFEHIREGDHILRLVGGKIPMRMLVQRVDEEFIYCAGGWKFRRDTGGEVDEDLEWDGVKRTGSKLTGGKAA